MFSATQKPRKSATTYLSLRSVSPNYTSKESREQAKILLFNAEFLCNP